MPIYSYKCKKCNETFDKMLKAGGNGNIKCIHCDSDSQRLFSPVGIIFKGSGFYVNDYKSNPNASGSADTNTNDKGRDKGLDKDQDKAQNIDKKSKEKKVEAHESSNKDTSSKDTGNKNIGKKEKS